jgi:hypothetical protein
MPRYEFLCDIDGDPVLARPRHGWREGPGPANGETVLGNPASRSWSGLLPRVSIR